MLKNILAIALLSSVSTLSLAESDTANRVHAGVKLGGAISGLDDFDNGNAFGFQLGFNFNNNFSAEFEYTKSNLDGPFDVELDTSSFGVYGTYRSSGQVYFLGKVGFIDLDITFESEQFSTSVSESETGLSYGIGGGYKITDSLGVEAEYTILDADLSTLGIVARYTF